tara:strand:+ start:210673 stop:211638 length:966 start_codon:yes stop_codon:yes gene_type:complete
MQYFKQQLITIICVISTLSITNPLSAQTEFETGIDPELVEIFLSSQFNGEVQLYADIPVNFPPFTLPQGFEVLGTIQTERENHVFLRTELASDVAGFTLTDALLTDGWLSLQEIAARNRPGPIPFVGMINRNNQGGAFCLDNYGVLGASLRDNGRFTVITLEATDASRIPSQLSCEMLRRASEQRQQQQDQMPNGSTFGYMSFPELEFPGTSTNNRRSFSSAPDPVTGSINYANSSPTFEVDWPLDEIQQHFDAQMLEQGWSLDTASIGETMALSGWNKTSEEDFDFSLVMSIRALGDEKFELRLNMTQTSQNTARIEIGR